jgi:hypothetical protein
MSHSITKTISNKGNECIFVDDFKYCRSYVKGNGTISWRCSIRNCQATVVTNSDCSDVLAFKLQEESCRRYRKPTIQGYAQLFG